MENWWHPRCLVRYWCEMAETRKNRDNAFDGASAFPDHILDLAGEAGKCMEF